MILQQRAPRNSTCQEGYVAMIELGLLPLIAMKAVEDEEEEEEWEAPRIA